MTNEEQQEVINTLYQKAYDDSLERIREESADLALKASKRGKPTSD